MPYTEILDNCVHSIGGVKDFYIATRDTAGSPLDFPLDVILESGSTNTILVGFNYTGRTLTVNNTLVTFRHVYPDKCSYTEEQVSTRQGDTYRKTLEWSMPKVNLTTNNQLKDFLFSASGEFAISNALVFFVDSNNQNWIAGFDLPFVLQDFDLDVGARQGDNQYTLRYVSNSYLRTFQYVVT